jgi:hypothetical protein
LPWKWAAGRGTTDGGSGVARGRLRLVRFVVEHLGKIEVTAAECREAAWFSGCGRSG